MSFLLLMNRSRQAYWSNQKFSAFSTLKMMAKWITKISKNQVQPKCWVGEMLKKQSTLPTSALTASRRKASPNNIYVTNRKVTTNRYYTGDEEVVLKLRHVCHRLPCIAGRPRRNEAGSSPHSLWHAPDGTRSFI